MDNPNNSYHINFMLSAHRHTKKLLLVLVTLPLLITVKKLHAFTPEKLSSRFEFSPLILHALKLKNLKDRKSVV